MPPLVGQASPGALMPERLTVHHPKELRGLTIVATKN